MESYSLFLLSVCQLFGNPLMTLKNGKNNYKGNPMKDRCRNFNEKVPFQA